MSKRKNVTNSIENTNNDVQIPQSPQSVWLYASIAAVFVAIIIIARMNLAALPFERDEGSYSYMGQLLLEGKKPYSYFYEMKLPGIFYCYAAIVAIFGKSIEGVHIGFMFITLISSVVMFLIGRLLFDNRAAAVATIAFSILSLAKFASGFAAQAEHLVVMWALLGLFFTLKALKSDKWYEYVLGGFFLGMSVLVKQSGVFFALATGLFLVFNFVQPLNVKAIISKGLLLVGGFAAALVLFLGIVAAQGGWSDMMFWVSEYPKIYISALPFDVGMRLLENSLSNISKDYTSLWYLAGFGVILMWFSALDLYKKVGLSVLLVLAFFSTSPGMRFYGHYFIQFMPALALLIAAFVYSVGDISSTKFNFQLGGTVALGLFLLLCVVTIQKQSNYYFAPNQFDILRQVYGDNPFVESKPIADKIKSMAKPEDQLLVLGSEPQINFYAQLHTPTRHSFMGFTSGNDDNAKKWREEVRKDVEAAKPRFIVFVNHPFSWSFPQGSDQELFKWGYSYMIENYDIVGIADIVPNARPIFVWDAAANTYKPKGEKYILVFKRK